MYFETLILTTFLKLRGDAGMNFNTEKQSQRLSVGDCVVSQNLIELQIQIILKDQAVQTKILVLKILN